MSTTIVVRESDLKPFLSEPPQQRAFRVLLSPLMLIGAPVSAAVGTADVWPFQTTPCHTHDTETEIWFCLEGRGYVKVGDAQYEATPGTLVTAPPGVPHQLVNPSDVHFKCLVIFTPAGPEKMFVEKVK